MNACDSSGGNQIGCDQDWTFNVETIASRFRQWRIHGRPSQRDLDSGEATVGISHVRQYVGRAPDDAREWRSHGRRNRAHQDHQRHARVRIALHPRPDFMSWLRHSTHGVCCLHALTCMAIKYHRFAIQTVAKPRPNIASRFRQWRTHGRPSQRDSGSGEATVGISHVRQYVGRAPENA